MTIAKNTKKAQSLIENAKNIRCYSLNNDFTGHELVSHPSVWEGGKIINISQPEFLRRELNGLHSKLTRYNDSGKYCIHVHSNLWYEFEAAGAQ